MKTKQSLVVCLIALGLAITTFYACQKETITPTASATSVIDESQEMRRATPFDTIMMKDAYSEETNFVRWVPEKIENGKDGREIIYKTNHPGYGNWIMKYSPDKPERNKITITPPVGNPNEVQYCITTECWSANGGKKYTVSCYSACTSEACCKLFHEWSKDNWW